MNIGGLYFEHGKCIKALIINTVNFNIVHSFKIDITNKTKSKAQYLSDFSSLTTWLDNHATINHYYIGPKLAGTAHRQITGKQAYPYDTADDSKAFLEIISGRSNIHYKSPKSISNKGVLELIFLLGSNMTHELYIAFIIMKEHYGSSVSYSQLCNKLKNVNEYKIRFELIELMLPTSQRKRIGLLAFKNAVNKWRNPKGIYKTIKESVDIQKKLAFDDLMSKKFFSY